MLVMVYTPLLNPTTLTDSVFYEWGEEYGIYSIGGVNYHRGMTQDQTASQPAEFSFAEGDFYFHQRTMYKNLITPATDTAPLMDANWSDFFLSAVNDNGRGLVIAADAAVIVTGTRTEAEAVVAMESVPFAPTIDKSPNLPFPGISAASPSLLSRANRDESREVIFLG
jgi:hypothetical protein